MAWLQSAGLLLFCAAGIYGSYLTQGVVQESLSTKKFGDELVRFVEYSTLLCLCFVNSIY